MKMETPKMDVVRFQEADVIVASPAPAPIKYESVTIMGLGNNNTNDNFLSFGTSSLDLQEAYTYHIQFGNGFVNNGSEKSLEDLVNEANTSNPIDSVNSDWNHTYNWNESAGKFVYNNQ